MPSFFNKEWLSLRPQLDALLGEELTIQHMIRGEFIGAQPDTTIPAFTAIGIAIIEDILAMGGALVSGTAERTDLILASPQITFLPDQFDTASRIAPVEGTRIIRSTFPGNPTFELISPPMIDSQSQLVCRLSPVLTAS